MVLMILGVVGAILLRSVKETWVFVNIGIGLDWFMGSLLAAVVVATAVLAVLSALRMKDAQICEKKWYPVLLLMAGATALGVASYAIGFFITMFSGESREVCLLSLREALAGSVLPVGIPFLLLFFPQMGSRAKKVVGALILVAVAVYGIHSYFPLTSYEISSTPMVLDNGSAYSIVFSTSDEGTGYVEYTYEGTDYKVYDQTGGRLNRGRIHSVTVPYEHLKNNTYTVSSCRVMEEFSYGSRTGETVTSVEYTFAVNESVDQNWLVISDWHTMLEEAYSAVGQLGEYDSVILLGDASPGVDYEEQVIRNIVEFGGQISGGTRPVFFVRGNHETRGAYASKLLDALGMESFYYQAEVGPYSFVMLDSGEDKPDAHKEYGGMTDYDTYRADMVEWLKEVEVNSEKVIAISHAWEISEVEQELSDAGFAELDRLGTRLLLSGHYHECRLLGAGDEREQEIFGRYPDLIGYLDGGKSGSNYIASKLVLSADGFEIRAVDMVGTVVINERFGWTR